jgi:hypothetical protein
MGLGGIHEQHGEIDDAGLLAVRFAVVSACHDVLQNDRTMSLHDSLSPNILTGGICVCGRAEGCKQPS